MSATPAEARSASFTKEECFRITELVQKHGKVIENKKTYSVTWQEKVRFFTEKCCSY